MKHSAPEPSSFSKRFMRKATRATHLFVVAAGLSISGIALVIDTVTGDRTNLASGLAAVVVCALGLGLITLWWKVTPVA